MKPLLPILILLSTLAAKPLPPSDAPFYMTVEAYVNGHKIGKNLQWKKRETWDIVAREIYTDVPVLFPAGSNIRFLVEWPRNGYEPLTIYGCFRNGVFLVVNRLEEC